jgi:UDP-N-acetylglucosamine 4-epimerase
MNELYADAFARCYGLATVGLRYFNVFGRRQDPDGAYAAVIPRWIAAMLRHEKVYIYGDGETSRDFCHIDNVVQANIRAATIEDPAAVNEVYNVAVGEQTSLNELFATLNRLLGERITGHVATPAIHMDFRPGDVRFSRADISKAQRLLGYEPTVHVQEGLARAADWYLAHVAPTRGAVTKTSPIMVPMAGGIAEGISLGEARLAQPNG